MGSNIWDKVSKPTQLITIYNQGLVVLMWKLDLIEQFWSLSFRGTLQTLLEDLFLTFMINPQCIGLPVVWFSNNCNVLWIQVNKHPCVSTCFCMTVSLFSWKRKKNKMPHLLI